MSDFLPTYLYIKRHLKTGLLYFGKTVPYRGSSKGDVESYMGSGKYWISHMKKHGKYIETLWYCLYTDKELLIEAALNLSKIMDIVNLKDENGKKIFANLIYENGIDGAAPGKRYSIEEKRKMSLNHWALGLSKELNPNTGSKRTSEACLKISEKAKGNKRCLNRIHTGDSKRRQSIAKTGKISCNEIRKLEFLEQAVQLFTLFKHFKFNDIISKNGKVLTAKRSFSNIICDQYGLTGTQVYKILSLQTISSKEAYARVYS